MATTPPAAEAAASAREPKARRAEASAAGPLETERRLRLLENLPVGCCLLDTELRYRYVNAHFRTITGVSDAHLGRRVREVMPDVADHVEPQLLNVLETGKPVVAEMIESSTLVTGGAKAHYQHNFAPLRSVTGEIVGVCCVVWDATRRRMVEAQLARVQRLESLGQLAAGVAHEVNTPAQFVGANLQFLRESFEAVVKLNKAYARVVDAVAAGRDPGKEVAAAQQLRAAADLQFLAEEIPRAIEQSLGGIRQIGHIVQAMSELSHPGSGKPELAAVNPLVETAIALTSTQWRYVAKIARDLDGSLPEIPCYPQDLSQVVLNLIVNAAQAIDFKMGDFGAKGTIRVSTRRAGAWVQICVEDTGCGIAPDIADRIFDPFFTTKDVGQGTGQGLALAHKTVVEQHGGRLEFESEPGAGTTFVVSLPVDPPRRTAG